MDITQDRDERLVREQTYYDTLILDAPLGRSLFDRMTRVFYDKSIRGRLWSPVWRGVDLRGKRVLDYGSGDGHFSYLLAERGADVTAIDISPESIRKAQQKCPSNLKINFLVRDAHATGFPDESFDFVFGNGTLHHLHIERAYAEVARILKPGGTAFFHEPMYYHPIVWLSRRVTPQLRSPDERPLSIPADVICATRWFRRASHREHFLFAVVAAPIHVLGLNVAFPIINSIDVFDMLLMKVVPGLKRLAWLCVMELTK